MGGRFTRYHHNGRVARMWAALPLTFYIVGLKLGVFVYLCNVVFVNLCTSVFVNLCNVVFVNLCTSVFVYFWSTCINAL